VPPYPEEPDYYSEPTAAARYGGYYDPAPQPEPPTPWYRRPAALIAAGAIGVILLGALVFTVVTLSTGSPAHSPATTTTTASTTAPSTTAPATTTAEAPRHHGGGGGAPTETVTETAPPPSTDTGTTTAPPSSVTDSPSTETSTVTQTVTVPPRRPFQPRP
jgi:hypothetical protein